MEPQRRREIRGRHRVRHETPRTTDPRSRSFSSVHAAYVVNCSSPYRQQRTAGAVRRRVEPQSLQLRPDSVDGQFLAVDRLCEPSYERSVEIDHHRIPQEGNSIRKRQLRQVKPNPGLRRQPRCCFSLHESHVDIVYTATETVVFGHGSR